MYSLRASSLVGLRGSRGVGSLAGLPGGGRRELARRLLPLCITFDIILIKYYRLSHDVVTWEVDRDVSTAFYRR